MDFKGLDLNLLVLLDVLLEEKNITRTGERIHLSQSATSGALARLRYYFKDELLVQVSHRLLLTPLAETLILPVRMMLMQAQVIAEATTQFSAATTARRVTLMCSDYVAAILMPRVVRVLQQRAPKMTIEMLPFADIPSEALARGDIDFLIMPEMHLSAGQPSRRLFEDEYACVVWAGNQDVGDTITTEQYLKMGHVSVLFGRQRNESVDENFFHRLGIERRSEIVVMNFNVVPQLLFGTTRIATMHRKLAELYAEPFSLRILDLPYNLPRMVEHLQWHQYRHQDPGHRWLRKVIRQVAAELDSGPSSPPVADVEVVTSSPEHQPDPGDSHAPL